MFLICDWLKHRYVTVVEGKDLAPADSNGLSDPYCVLKVQLLMLPVVVVTVVTHRSSHSGAAKLKRQRSSTRL